MIKEQYISLLTELNKYNDLLKQNYEIDIRDTVKKLIKKTEIEELFGISIPNYSNTDWYNISDEAAIGLYGKKYNRTISWLEDGAQPEEEWLYSICYPCGPYTFNDGYPIKSFTDFFNELKTYQPKYSDTMNNSLYFSSTKAKYVHENLREIFKKYHNKAKCEQIETLKIKLEQELEELKKIEETK